MITMQIHAHQVLKWLGYSLLLRIVYKWKFDDINWLCLFLYKSKKIFVLHFK